jgi:hypothetical protein
MYNECEVRLITNEGRSLDVINHGMITVFSTNVKPSGILVLRRPKPETYNLVDV